MYEINGTSIRLTRGDSFYCQVTIKNSDGTDYVPEEGDTVRFALKRNYKDGEQVLILKDIPTDTLLLHLEPEDTKNLEYKEYVYDIELTNANGDVDTFIEKAKFKISEEVY